MDGMLRGSMPLDGMSLPAVWDTFSLPPTPANKTGERGKTADKKNKLEFKDDFPTGCHTSQNIANEFELDIETKLLGAEARVSRKRDFRIANCEFRAFFGLIGF